MKQLLLSLLMLAALTATYAQQDSMAVARYREAEKAFSNDDFTATVSLLEKAEQLLGKTNSKIRYLKIRGLHEIYKTDGSLSRRMEQELAGFFAALDKDTCPAEKIAEVEKIRQEFINFQKSDKASFTRAMITATTDAVASHLNNFPATFFKRQSDSLVLAVKDKLRKELLERNMQEKNAMLLKARKLQNAAAGKSVKGGVLLLAGLGSAAYTGMKAYDFYFVKMKKDNTPQDYSNAGKTPPDLQQEYQKMAIIYGSTALASVLVGVPWSLSSFKKARRLRQQSRTLREQAGHLQVSALPYASPLTRTFGLTLHATF